MTFGVSFPLSEKSAEAVDILEGSVMKIEKVCVFLLMGAVFSLSCYAQDASRMTKEQCLACHGGSFDALVNKDFQIEAVPKPINPHLYIPHDGSTKDFFDCLLCHQQHKIPPEKGWHDRSAGLDPCFGCHHTEEFQKCSECHDKK